MTNQAFSRDNLTAHEREIHDEVLRTADETGRDCRDILLEVCGDSYHGARVAEVLGGPDAPADFRAQYTEQKLLAEPDNAYDYGEKLARDMADGRIGVVHAHWDGYELVEFADGTQVRAACDLQEVGPDPDVQAHAEELREDAERARTNAANCSDPEAAARWQEEAEQAEQQADRVEASSMDWLADPAAVYGFDGPPPAADLAAQPTSTADAGASDEPGSGAAETAHHHDGHDDTDGM